VAVKLPVRTDGKYDPAANRATLEDLDADPRQRMWAASRLACAERLAEPIELSVLELDGAAILHLPGEPMLEYQHFAQRICPERFLAVAGYGLGSTGYVCTEKSYEEGGYEPTASALEPQAEHVMKPAIKEVLGVK
jgi:hypothetical protein